MKHMHADVVIASSGTDSTNVDLDMALMGGFVVPAAFTGTTITFKAAGPVDSPIDDAPADAAFNDLYFEGTQVSMTVAVDQFVTVDPSKFVGVRWLKLVSGSAEGAERTVRVFYRYGR